MQLLITSKSRADFDTKVNDALFHGATIVPGTLTIGMTSFRKADGRTYAQSRYTAVVELIGVQTEALVAIRAAIAAEQATPCCGCGDDDDDSCDYEE